jgi:cytochrome c peroxidase
MAVLLISIKIMTGGWATKAQNMLDFPPAPKLNRLRRLERRKATDQELAGEQLFVGKAQCAVCHPAPFYLDYKMHDLHLEEFLDEPGDGAPLRSAESKRARHICTTGVA